jgi:hypothetical protein
MWQGNRNFCEFELLASAIAGDNPESAIARQRTATDAIARNW